MKRKQTIRRSLGWLMCLLMIATLLVPTMASAASLKKPKLSSVKIVNTGVKFKWKSVSGAASYRVYRKTDGSGWKKLAKTTKTSYTDTTVEEGKTYSYTVCCLDSAGKKVSKYDNKGLTIKFKPIAKYSEPKLKSVAVKDYGVKFSWKSVSGATQYRVYRKKNGSDWKEVATTSSTNYKDTDVKSGTEYTYTVRAEGSSKAGSSYNKTGLSITYFSAPVMISAESVAKGIEIKWSKVSGAPYYGVMRKPVTSSKSPVRIAVVKGTSYTDTTVVETRKYEYQVVVLGADQKTKLSVVSPYIIGVYRGRIAVSSLTNLETGVRIKWNAISEAAEYNVYRKFGEGSWKKIASTGSTSYVDGTAQNNITYTYRVKAVDGAGESICSYDTAGKSITYFAVPTLVSCVREGTGLKVTWQAVEGVSYYAVLRKVGGGVWEYVTRTSSTSYTDLSVPSATAARYTVRCADADGNYLSDYNGTGVGATTYTDTPVMTGATNGNGYINITWGDVDTATNYNVYRRTGEKESWTKIASAVSGTGYSDPGPVNGKTYYYAVSVSDGSGNDLSLYNTAGISITYYDMPKNLSVSNGATGVEFTWDKVDGIGSYQIYRKTGSSSWVKVGTAATNSYTDQTVVNLGHYTYTVSCLKGGSEVSTKHSTGEAIQFHSAPRIAGLTNEDGKIKVTWNTVDGISVYRLYCKVGSGSWQKVYEGANASYTETGVTSGTKYTYKAVCLESGTVVSASGNELSVTYLAPPSNLATTLSGGITLTWSKVTGAASYEIYRRVGTDGSFTKVGTTTDAKYVDGNVVEHVGYTYYVVAVNGTSRSANSDTVRRTVE